MRSTTILDGIEVIEEGEGDEAIVMIHGWPDTHRLWDTTVAALRPHMRCVRFTLPGYDLAQPQRPTSVAQMTEFVGSSRVDLQACKLEYSIVSPK